MRMLSIAFLVLSVAVLRADEPKPIRFELEDGKIAAAFPGKPSVSTNSIPTPAGDVDIVTAAVQVNGAQFAVAWSKLPGDFPKKQPQKSLDGAAFGAVSNSGGTTLEIRRIVFTYGKIPGRSVLIELPDDRRIRSMIYLRDRQLYQVLIEGSEKDISSATADAFFKSIEIIK